MKTPFAVEDEDSTMKNAAKHDRRKKTHVEDPTKRAKMAGEFPPMRTVEVQEVALRKVDCAHAESDARLDAVEKKVGSLIEMNM